MIYLKERRRDRILGFILVLFFRIESWLCSLPALVTLILHFTVGLSIGWFFLTFVLWLAVGFLRYALICFGRWGRSKQDPVRENKNPYSSKLYSNHRSDDSERKQM